MSDSFEPVLPSTYSSDWRKAYRYDTTDLPRLTSYQAPGGTPVPFVLKTIDVSGGHTGQNTRYPYYGWWSTTHLNEKPHEIKLSGVIRGDEYIKNRTDLWNALRVQNDDDNCGYLDLPTWGRFPVVVDDWSVGEDTEKNGQCTVSINFVRAGWSDLSRVTAAAAVDVADVADKADRLTSAVSEDFISVFDTVSNLDKDTLVSCFGAFVSNLQQVIGRIQGGIAYLNKMAGAVAKISSLLAQGVRLPSDLVLALFSAAATIVSSIAEIGEAATSYETLLTGDYTNMNKQKALNTLLTANSYTVKTDAITAAQQKTKKTCENLYRVCAYVMAARLLPELDATYDKQLAMWKIFQRLEDTIDMENSEVYIAVEELRTAVVSRMASKNAEKELSISIKVQTPILALAEYLGCNESKIRELNIISDSFLISGDVIYV